MPQIEPAPHEINCHLYYHPKEHERYNGLDPYWTVASLLINEYDGDGQLTSEMNGESWKLTLRYSKSGFAPRPQDAVDERLYEIDLHLEGRGERKCHYNISPRFPDMKHWESGESLSFPFRHLDALRGCTVQAQPSNLKVDEITDLLPKALQAFAENADEKLDPRYFEEPQGGRISAFERYVRITRDMNRKLINKGGLFDKIAMLMSSQDGTKGIHKWDNSKEEGYREQVRIGKTGAKELIPTRSRGKQFKSYLPENPENFEEGDPLYYPKFGVLFRKSLNDNETVPWSRRHDLVEELDEQIINCLEWADIPTTVSQQGTQSNTVFIADDHFKIEHKEDSVPVSENPLPRIESEQDHLLMTVLRDMTKSDTEIVETVATDGGRDVDKIADESGYSLSTIYRALERLDGLLESRDGHVRFVSEKIAEEVRGIVQSAESKIESAADRAAELLDIEINQSSNSAVSRWLAEYGAQIETPTDENDTPTIRIDTLMSELKSRPQPYLPDVLDYLVHAWISDGRRKVDIEEMIVDVQLADGTHYRAPVRTLR